MFLYLTKAIKIPIGKETDEAQEISRFCGIPLRRIKSFRLHRKSVDARKKSDVCFVCSYVLETDVKDCPRNCIPFSEPRDFLADVPCAREKLNCVVVGAGPSGLFAARYLTAAGHKVTVVERGGDVEKRAAKVKEFFGGGALDVMCNVQFGLGGAGTFSDGKLTTGISSPLIHTVFSEFLRCGAPDDIMTSAAPHIGTDYLVRVVAAMRDRITQYGGEFLFDTLAEDLITDNGTVKGVTVNFGGVRRNLYADRVFLAVGHSARDTFYTLKDRGADMCFKPFAVGVRVEHPREFINIAQYGEKFASCKLLSSAVYKMAVKVNDRNCYTFCMCPGGTVVAASSEENTVVVNGMSNFDRAAFNSNSAIVVNVTKDDVGNTGGALCGMEFQRTLERRCFEAAGDSYAAPSQNVTDFLRGKVSTEFSVAPSYPRGTVSTDLAAVLPVFVTDTLKAALPRFGRMIEGFDRCGVMTAVESRTSCPVRILRGENFQSNLRCLYPVGEGAGYSGGIVSSAVDGLKAAMSVCL